MKQDKNMTYSEAVSELEVILQTLESTDEIDMDKVAIHVKRASELMDFCKKKLFILDETLTKMIAEL